MLFFYTVRGKGLRAGERGINTKNWALGVHCNPGLGSLTQYELHTQIQILRQVYDMARRDNRNALVSVSACVP